MHQRNSGWRRAPAVAIAALAMALFGPGSALAQTQAPEGGTVPRTPWGDPDLQAIWNNSTITPLQRPGALRDQAFLSDEEAAALERLALERVNQANAPSAVRTEPLPVGGNVGAYNSFWTDQRTSVVGTQRTSIITSPENGRLPLLTDEALERLASPETRRLADVRDGRIPANGPEEMGLSERCLWYRGIPTIPTGYNNNFHFFQTPEMVIILQEHIHDLRFIAIDGRPHLPEALRQFAGSSRGHWEGDTLVVETTNLRQPFIRRWARREHSLERGDMTEAVRVVERFTRVGPDTLDVTFTVDDPGTWVQPWSGALPMPRTDGPMFEFSCHEGNYGMLNMMAGSRAEEAETEGRR